MASHRWGFDDPGPLEALETIPLDRIDEIGFGLIVMNRSGEVTGYNGRAARPAHHDGLGAEDRRPVSPGRGQPRADRDLEPAGGPGPVADRTIGALGFGFRAAGPVSADIVHVAETLAELTGQALERARRHEDDHAVAHQLQQALLPKVPAELRGAGIGVC